MAPTMAAPARIWELHEALPQFDAIVLGQAGFERISTYIDGL